MVVGKGFRGEGEGREQFQPRCGRGSKIEVVEGRDEAPPKKGVSEAFIANSNLADLASRRSLARGKQVEFDGGVVGELGIEFLPSGKAPLEVQSGGGDGLLNAGLIGGARHGAIAG